MTSEVTPPSNAQGIGSVESGVRVLGVIARLGRSLSLTEIAQEAEMTPARLHRYLVSLIRGGFVEQKERGGRYDLGPAALELGMCAIRRLDPQTQVWRASRSLGERLHLGVAVSVWVHCEAVIIAHHHGPSPVSVSARPGQRLPPLHTAVGRTFLAHMDNDALENLLDDEYDAQSPPHQDARALSRSQFIAELAAIRSRGIACLRGALAPHINALAAPVFDQWGEVSMVISVLADHHDLDADPEGEAARELRRTTEIASHTLGHRP